MQKRIGDLAFECSMPNLKQNVLLIAVGKKRSTTEKLTMVYGYGVCKQRTCFCIMTLNVTLRLLGQYWLATDRPL